MFLKFFAALIGVILGVIASFFFTKTTLPGFSTQSLSTVKQATPLKKAVIGFLPYALLSRAQSDYSHVISTLAYFGLTVDSDGSILKLTTPQESEPGWYALSSGKVETFLNNAKQHNIALSLVLFNGNNDAIETLMQDPLTNAARMTNEVIPLMDQYGFTDLNLDIEHTRDASPEAQLHFLQFTQEVKKQLTAAQKKTLTLDISTVDLINSHTLIIPKEAARIADNIVIMAYDFHSTSSLVSGPIAPQGGAGIESEYDIQAAVQKALQVMPAQKIILGAPLYGYEWETLGNTPRSAVIPASGATASNRRAEELVSSCATCSAKFDKTAQEAYLIYANTDSQTYYQMFYPTKESIAQKIIYANNNQLKGLALWALGYEGSSILQPLQQYLQ